MNPEAPESLSIPDAATPGPAWPRLRWWLWVLAVFAAHLILFQTLSNHRPRQPRPVQPPQTVNFVAQNSEWLALTDPTLFALPNVHGAADRIWLKVPPVPYAPYHWSEPPHLLQLRPEAPGHDLGRFLQSNAFATLAFETKPAPEPYFVATLSDLDEPAIADSKVSITGELARRRWLNQPILPSWTNSDLVTNTVVQALVNAAGEVKSATLLVIPGTDTNAQSAATLALQLIRDARFEPDRSGAGFTLGTLLFQWRTEPPVSSSPP